MIAQLSSGIVMIVFNTIILKLEGNTGVAAYGVVANISLVIIAVYTGIAHGVQPLISTFYGVGNDRQTKTVLRYAVTTMLFVSAIVYLLIFIFAQPITSVFNSENNIGLQQIAVTELKLYFISTPFVGYNIILATFFTSIGKALPAHILSILRGLVLIIPMAFFLSAIWEISVIVGEQKFKLPNGRFKVILAVRESTPADHKIPKMRVIPLTDMEITPVHLFHCHRGHWQGSVNEIFKPGGHSVGIARIAEQQQVTGQHLFQNLPHIVIYHAASAVTLTGKAAFAELDVLVYHINGLYLLGGGFLHAVQKGAGDVHGIAFLFLRASVKNENFHV